MKRLTKRWKNWSVEDFDDAIEKQRKLVKELEIPSPELVEARCDLSALERARIDFILEKLITGGE